MEVNVSKRFEELIARGKKLHKNSEDRFGLLEFFYKLSDQQLSDSVAWRLSSENLLKQVYSKSSDYSKLFSELFSNQEKGNAEYCKENIANALGILTSAKEEFDLGFTDKLTHILAVEFFDGILDQAKELLKKGFKDPSAILGRVIIENILKDLCKINKIEFKKNEGASSLNEKLKNEDIFTLPQFKLCRINIELGNDAAHGEFNKYSREDVKKMFDYIENSLLIM